MKVNNTIVNNTNIKNNNQSKRKNIEPVVTSPSFKAGGTPVDLTLNLMGATMQWIQEQGFLASFLIQDVLGMTAPRVGAAFLRDKEVTGKYNVQEGFEVLGREGLTGPCMMAVAPIMFLLAAKFGKTTGVNSQLIKRFGDSLKEVVTQQGFNNKLLETPEKFKKEFYKINIEKILKDSLGKNNIEQKTLNMILEEISKYEAGNNKTKKECITKITKTINDIMYSKSSNLENLNKVKVGSEKANSLKEFATSDTIEALVKYSDEAITLNKQLADLNGAGAEDIKNKALAKRFITNISTMAATLGLMSVLPKIYARSNIAPGAATAMQLREQQDVKENNKNSSIDNSNNVSFKGSKKSVLSKFGKFLSKHFKDSWAGELEYNGHNFTNTLMAGLSLGGLLAPRGYRAYSRAQVDENGKKDLTELYEILIRDIASSLSVVFLVPMLTRGFVTSYENSSGFVLMNKDRNKTGIKKVLDLLNPYSSSHVLSNSELQTLYNGVNSKDKMNNFCDFIIKNNGDLYKILLKSEELPNFAKNKKIELDLNSMKNMPKADRNNKIKEIFKNLNTDDADQIITKIMKGTKGTKANKIAGFAKGLNSIPAIITTFLISPYVLGWVIPRFTYANTRRLHAEAEEKRKNTTNTNI